MDSDKPKLGSVKIDLKTIPHYLPKSCKNKKISFYKRKDSHSNLTEGTAGFTHLEAVLKNDAKSHYWAVLKNRYFRPCTLYSSLLEK